MNVEFLSTVAVIAPRSARQSQAVCRRPRAGAGEPGRRLLPQRTDRWL